MTGTLDVTSVREVVAPKARAASIQGRVRAIPPGQSSFGWHSSSDSLWAASGQPGTGTPQSVRGRGASDDLSSD
ncbi:hypothetical protein [Kamptonema formosum]|uniref:hypothetical protein n=1 Tax=Kamptonema formosum TaxID=331992 RepID=UPI0012DEC8F2|nr:hypothetical protein [Oscillatoria sp. PCC 10802]